MATERVIRFVAGLPRSGSTLLMNILGQNPRFRVTPTSGILQMLVQVRNTWDQNPAFRAMERKDSEAAKVRVMKAMLAAYFESSNHPVCFDKNRTWLEFLEMAGALLGGNQNVKVLVTVRDLRDVLASFELRHRETSALGRIPQEAQDPTKFKTATSRLKTFIEKEQPVGSAYNAIRDALTRGWRENLHFVEYEELTSNPSKTMDAIYTFLKEPPFVHDFDNVAQLTQEDDLIHGFKRLHQIRPRVEPQSPRWPTVFDNSVTDRDAWKEVEKNAQFWRANLS